MTIAMATQERGGEELLVPLLRPNKVTWVHSVNYYGTMSFCALKGRGSMSRVVYSREMVFWFSTTHFWEIKPLN